MEPDRIDYYIREDGTCSYCGLEADMVELPDGDFDYSDTCLNCEAYNDEEQVLAFLAYGEEQGWS